MQTFLPSSSFVKSAKCLDNKRLGKQRVEAFQILQCLLVKETRWKHHPAVLMWKGYEKALYAYMIAICNEWQRRGFKNTKMEINMVRMHLRMRRFNSIEQEPPWLGNRGFHASHRSNLLRKNPEHYSKFKWCEPNDLPYVWPVENSKTAVKT